VMRCVFPAMCRENLPMRREFPAMCLTFLSMYAYIDKSYSNNDRSYSNNGRFTPPNAENDRSSGRNPCS
jgi:hypothetical protein